MERFGEVEIHKKIHCKGNEGQGEVEKEEEEVEQKRCAKQEGGKRGGEEKKEKAKEIWERKTTFKCD